MEALTEYFENSTIHGLSYFVSTKTYIRLAWILIVIAGFSVSGNQPK